MDHKDKTASSSNDQQTMRGHPAALSVSVVVPVHGDGEAFRQCLLSLSNLDPAPNEIIVVADGDPEAACTAEEFGFVAIRQPHSSGPAGARNVGAGLAHGDVLFFVDSDVTVPPDAVCQVLEAMETHQADAVLGSYDDAPAATNFLSQYRNLLHHFVHQTAKTEASTFWGACGAIRRDVFLAAGGFDGTYKQPCIEDIEFGYRLKQAGRRIRLCKSLQVKHWKRWDSLTLLRTDFFQRALPWTELILRRRWFINDLNLRVASRVSVVLAWCLVAAMAAAPWRSEALLAVAALAAGLLALNAPLYRFFWAKRGLWFAVGAAAWHGLYYLYGGAAFGIGLARHALEQAGLRKTSAVPSWRPGGEAEYWDAVLADMRGRRQGLWRRHCESVHAAWLADALPAGPLRRVLKTDLFDEAMGDGLYGPLAARAERVTGVDVSAGICRAAAANHAGLEAVQADVRCLPFPDGAFDAIVSNSTLDHFGSSREIAAALRELARVLRGGGVLALTLDNPANPVVLLRGLLPQRLLNDLGVVPYQVGPPCGHGRLERFVRQAGLKIQATSAIMHCPRLPAVALAGLLADARPRLQERFLRMLAAMERLGALPTRYLTGYFSTVLAVKPPEGL